MKLDYSKLFVFGLVMIMLASLSVVSAQQTNDISGYVQDQDGNSVSYVNVQFASEIDGTPYNGNTDGGGNFNINGIPDGNYNVNINAGGYDDYNGNVYVDGGSTYFDFSMTSQNTGGDGGGGDGEDIDPFGDVMGEFEQIIMYLLMAVALFYLLLIIITIMTIAIFVRLGKIKKSTAALKDTVVDLNNKTMAPQPQYQQPVQQQYQQPAPQQEEYQQPPPPE